ncbi:MAG: sigma 54-interacting transcriptional regulator [Myxococcales bacterium]|nr:sigma 54-interacting transcriptional regulator [Myxococcales bacterium]
MPESFANTSRFAALDEASLWRGVAEGTAGEVGTDFFATLVRSLCSTIGTYGAWVTDWRSEEKRLHSYSMYLGGEFIPDFNYDIAGTPCERVVETKHSIIHIADDILSLYPDNAVVRQTCAVSFMGMALLDVDGSVLGHLAVLDQRPMPAEPRLESLFRVFSARAGAELRRLRAEEQLRLREAKLARLIDGAMDAIVDLDRDFHVTHANAAAASVFEVPETELLGKPFARLLAPDSMKKLRGLARALDARPQGQRSAWVAGGLSGRNASGTDFPAEASMSRSEDKYGHPFYTLILRNVNERLNAERTIELLASETEYLRAALSAEKPSIGMLGESPAFLEMRAQIDEVAATDATVLVTGETGTGKELVADALHALSPRSKRRIVKVNCGAIPENLLESEFFGHEAGSYTGATRAREGRFTLADGGTLFLDEVGELPLSLQPKLLRVLQSGEFEPVGSSRTRRVSVRVIAATHRNLLDEVRAGRFREDLYYRLAVFPIRVPALRERPDDIPLLARSFTHRIAERMGKSLEPPSDFSLARLQSYPWPGNVRELVNIVERAVITARGTTIDLSAALPNPSAEQAARAEPRPAAPPVESAAVLTLEQLRELEKRNIARALERCGGAIGGKHGAAALLGMKPSTLRSRLLALGLERRSV